MAIDRVLSTKKQGFQPEGGCHFLIINKDWITSISSQVTYVSICFRSQPWVLPGMLTGSFALMSCGGSLLFWFISPKLPHTTDFIPIFEILSQITTRPIWKLRAISWKCFISSLYYPWNSSIYATLFLGKYDSHSQIEAG